MSEMPVFPPITQDTRQSAFTPPSAKEFPPTQPTAPAPLGDSQTLQQPQETPAEAPQAPAGPYIHWLWNVENSNLDLDGRSPDEWLNLPEAELGTLDNKHLAKAIPLAKLALSGTTKYKLDDMLRTETDSDMEIITNYIYELIEGKYPTRFRDLIGLSPEQLAAFPPITDLQRNAGALAKRWLAGDTTGVYEACDSTEIIDIITDILEDDEPEKGKMFRDMLAAKREALVPTPEKLGEMWLAGDKMAVARACAVPGTYEAVIRVLEHIDPEHKFGTLEEYIKSLK